MGWNSWNYFAAASPTRTSADTADLLVSTGMRDAGYIYVNIDDTWEGERDAQGIIHTNKKFPDMKALSDYVHSKGLKLGIYSSPGATKPAPHFEGSLGHEASGRQDLRRLGHRLSQVRPLQLSRQTCKQKLFPTILASPEQDDARRLR